VSYKIKVKILLLLFFAFLLKGCADRYVPFQRVDYDPRLGDFLIFSDFSDHYKYNVIYVLIFFGEEYCVKNDKLYITGKLWKDKDLLWNICNKATDDWIDKRIDKNEEKYRVVEKLMDNRYK